LITFLSEYIDGNDLAQLSVLLCIRFSPAFSPIGIYPDQMPYSVP